jgi:predicted kinase
MDLISFKLLKEKFDERYMSLLQREPQYIGYHAEGDVYTHTMMVVKNALEKGLSIEMIIAAFLHDIGKPIVKREVGDRIIHTDHEYIGTLMAIDFLKELKLSTEIMLKILYIINYHSLYWRKTKLFHNLMQYEPELFEELRKFHECDTLGRISFTERHKMVFNGDFFPQPKKQEYDKTVYFLIGLPGVGKDTYLKNNNIPKEQIVSRDDILIEYGKRHYRTDKYNEIWGLLSDTEQENINRITDKTLKQKIEEYDTVYLNMTNVSFKSRRRKLSFLKGVNVKYVCFLEGWGTILRRNSDRTDKRINYDVLLSMGKRFELPLIHEHRLCNGIEFII